MFGFSSKNPNVILSDFNETLNKFNNLSEGSMKTACGYVKEIVKSNFRDLALSKQATPYFLKYFEDIVNSNKKNERQWRAMGIYESKQPEIIAFELVYYYVKAVAYDDKMIALRTIMPRIFAICETSD